MTNINRDGRLDLLRIIAISLIVLMHAPLPDSGAPGFVLAGISYFTAPGLVLFFMLSGALLLDNDLSSKDFLKRRFSKILYPTLFWTLFYLSVEYLTHSPSKGSVLRSIMNIPFVAQGHGVLWFMYTLAGLYLLTPILSRWLRNASKREVEFYLLLWAVTLIYPYVGLWLQIDESKSGLLYYFAGYVGYYILGYYLMHCYEYRLWHVFVAALVALIIPLVLYSSGCEFDFYSVLWYLSLPVAMMSFGLFVLIMRLPNKQLSGVRCVSKLSFGIFFIHIFVMRSIIWNLDVVNSMNWTLQIPVIVLTSFLLSLLASWTISRLPFSKFIIGV